MALKSTERMKEARRIAIERLRAMSFDQLLERSLANQDSTTVEFLSACSQLDTLIHSHELEEAPAERSLLKQQYTISFKFDYHVDYHREVSGAMEGGIHAALSACGKALRKLTETPEPCPPSYAYAA
ncbi:TPA: hypothetical protein ACXIHA_003842 [Pseudomonas aeruginosa]|uniref:hypothetical protein n=1 Tax=Pseudomonas aeruginosa TaxID=287 RepID=UPI00130E3B59|nr:hypothetical protein [Pseudomonas aeruginosa]MBA4929629.1 hypothetical protein [Pseudomonas aeruginosa]MBH8737454.1 hypothetical protein [Pseudomonas aeruginosa]MBO0969442.1 hypothetical protein [Pseudomonas aeruginosa]MBX5512955.1 hypothetical protein [Pseudomonas aeruginosa]MBX5536732.1 hypothetical protein [Pseudomonas aeruginosa]